MLVFYRPAFKSGMMIVKDRKKDGKEIKLIVKAKQNGGEMDFLDPKWAASKCPFLITPEEHQNRVKQDREAKDEKRARVF